MRNSITIIISFVFFMSCQNSRPGKNAEFIDENAMAIIEFNEEAFDFGEVAQGEKVIHEFWFKNTGNADLILTDVIPSCGCTVPDYDKEPIAPGDSGKIKVLFNTRGRSGKQYKTVKVSSNAENSLVKLSFNAMVIDNE